MNKEIGELRRSARRQGWAVNFIGSGHLRFQPPVGRFVIASATPTAPTADQTTVIGDEVERLLRRGALSDLVADVVHAPFFEVRLTNGSVILARSAQNEGKYLRGRAAHRVIVDECAYVNERTLQEVILPMLADTAGQLVLISTPAGHNAFFRWFQRGQSGDPACRSFQFPSRFNPHISRAYIEQQRGIMTDLQYRVAWLAEFCDDQNTVFRWSLIERAMGGELSAPVPGQRYSVGWDPAKYHDRSAIVVLDVTEERPQHVVYCETVEGRDYRLQINRVAKIAASYNADVLMDTTGNAALLEQMQSTGTRVKGFTFTNATKQELIDGLVLALEQDRVTFPPTLSALIAELRYYEYRMTAAGNVQLGAPDRAGATDDLTTALALALKGGQHSQAAGVWFIDRW